jgi:ADP-ribose pyrophosphatase YjhB (NUDIX family)
MADQLFYVGQKAFIEKDGKVLVLKHEKGLDFPGGKVTEGQLDFTEELKREVREETGLEIEVGDPFVVWHTKFPKNGHFIYLVGFKCRYVSGELKLSDEHTGHEWIGKNDYQAFEDEFYFPALKKYFLNEK